MAVCFVFCLSSCCFFSLLLLLFLLHQDLGDDCIRQRFWFRFLRFRFEKLFRKMQNRDIHVDAVRYYAQGLPKKKLYWRQLYNSSWYKRNISILPRNFTKYTATKILFDIVVIQKSIFNIQLSKTSLHK